MTWVRLLRPQSLWHWVLLALAVLLALVNLSFALAGYTDYGLLDKEGTDQVVPVQRVLETADGKPSVVEIAGGSDQLARRDPVSYHRAYVVDDLDGSLVGTDQVRVRIVTGTVVMSQTRYHSLAARIGADYRMPVIFVVLAGLVVFLSNLREHRRPTHDLTWASQPPRPAAG